MAIPLIELKIKDQNLRSEIDAEIKKILDNAGYIGGEQVQKFAEEFAAFCGGGHCVPVANGTDALILSLKALGIGPGDEVITVPFTFIATAEAISIVGAVPKFVDIDPKSYNLDVNLLERAIGPKTRAIIPVHLFGQPADMDPIMTIARKHDLKVIEDACQAHGAEYKNKRVGLLSDAGCFSFYPTKNLGGAGDGGAVTTSSPVLAKKIEQLANHGRAAQYFHEIIGLNSRLDRMQAAILRLKLKRLNKFNERRRQIAEIYFKNLRNNPSISLPHIDSFAKHVFHLFCVESSRREEIMKLLKSEGIGHGVYYPLPIHLQPAYAFLNLPKGSFPMSERASQRIFALPMFPELANDQVERICEVLNKMALQLAKTK